MQTELSSDEHEPVPSSILSSLTDEYDESEVIIGLVGAVGTELDAIIRMLRTHLSSFKYAVKEIRVSKDIIAQGFRVQSQASNEYQRINDYMNYGDDIRSKYGNNVLALGVASVIKDIRLAESPLDEIPVMPKTAFVINSLKHPDEVKYLRRIYSHGFFLIGVYSDEKSRKFFLQNERSMTATQANEIIKRDSSEDKPYGQSTRDTFHLADFFIYASESKEKVSNNLLRILDLIFGYPYITPTFDEFAMFMAFSSSLRSADLSRQVGAVVTKDSEIIGLGANDCPKYGGGLYWPQYHRGKNFVCDVKGGRDYTRGYDSNKKEKDAIIRDISHELKLENIDSRKIETVLNKSAINDITEYGRVVHAEMEALLSCGRTGTSTRGATLYCTTFPCHNCAKHIVAAGIKRVVYVEPYPKSKAASFHNDSIYLGLTTKPNVVQFEPFIGVGPRRFFDLFAMNLGSGYPMKRKTDSGAIIDKKQWKPMIRTQLRPLHYLFLEDLANVRFVECIKNYEARNGKESKSNQWK